MPSPASAPRALLRTPHAPAGNTEAGPQKVSPKHPRAPASCTQVLPEPLRSLPLPPLLPALRSPHPHPGLRTPNPHSGPRTPTPAPADCASHSHAQDASRTGHTLLAPQRAHPDPTLPLQPAALLPQFPPQPSAGGRQSCWDGAWGAPGPRKAARGVAGRASPPRAPPGTAREEKFGAGHPGAGTGWARRSVRTRGGSGRRRLHGSPCSPCTPGGPSGRAAPPGAAAPERAARGPCRRC